MFISRLSQAPFKLMFALFLLMPGIMAIPTHAQSTGERIAFAGYRNGQWDIYSIASDGTNLHQLTNNSFEDTDPVYSPNGAKIAFASRRDNNWDVYILDLSTGQETRLTNSPHYDGAPTWSPDGTTMAYESFHNGNLDIWQVPVNGSRPPANLTAASDAGDFAPAWSPDGRYIAFTSWRDNSKDLFLLDVANAEVTQLTNAPTAEEWAAWHPGPNVDKLAFVVDNLGYHEIFTLDITNPPVGGGPIEQATWLGRTGGPVWSPTGETIAALFHRWDGEIVTIQTPGAMHQLPHELTDVAAIQGRLTWHGQPIDFGQPVSSLAGADTSLLYDEDVVVNPPGGEPYNLVRQDDITTGTPWLADTVDDSFQAWRNRLLSETGYDFLQELSDASRDVAAYTETSQYASWHKSGRAVDTLFDYHAEGQLVHEIVKEDYSGEIYWRVYLRCLDQTGRCGRPITANSWNYSARARTEVAPEQGGIERPNLNGYYVDMTAAAREYGWDRISSYDDEDYSWTWHFLAFEYWHYQKRLEQDAGSSTGASNWYQAMSHVYTQDTLDRYFSWQKMRQLGEDPHLVALKGVPLPLEVKPWWSLVEQ